MRGRPGPRRWLQFHFVATSSRCHRNKGVRCDQRFQFVQHFAPEHVRFSRESSTFGVGEANAASAQAFLENAIFFLEVVDRIQLITADPSRERHQQQVQRLKQGGIAAE